MENSKPTLRRRLMREQRLLPPMDTTIASSLVALWLFEMIDWSVVHAVHMYRQLPGKGELSTDPLVDLLATLDNPPQVVYAGSSVEAAMPKAAFDLIIVPMLAYTDDCFRLGRGGGWYDRFLAKHPEALAIGLAYHDAIVDFKPEPHDIQLDCVVTEQDVIYRPSLPVEQPLLTHRHNT